MRLLEDQVNRKWSIEGIKAIDTLKDRLLRYLQVISQEGRAVTKEVRQKGSAHERSLSPKPHLCRTLRPSLHPLINRLSTIPWRRRKRRRRIENKRGNEQGSSPDDLCFHLVFPINVKSVVSTIQQAPTDRLPSHVCIRDDSMVIVKTL